MIREGRSIKLRLRDTIINIKMTDIKINTKTREEDIVAVIEVGIVVGIVVIKQSMRIKASSKGLMRKEKEIKL